MKRWLARHLAYQGGVDAYGKTFEFEVPDWWANFIAKHNAHEPWSYEAWRAANLVVKTVKWPTRKPAAIYTIDDRAHQFTGEWPTLESIASFKPWNKRA